VIVRILTEGQWNVSSDRLDALNELDSDLEKAVQAGDSSAFSQCLDALLHAVRTEGEPLPDDVLHDSDLILPPSDATIEEVRELLGDDGLIPG
jgi:PspAA-like protein